MQFNNISNPNNDIYKKMFIESNTVNNIFNNIYNNNHPSINNFSYFLQNNNMNNINNINLNCNNFTNVNNDLNSINDNINEMCLLNYSTKNSNYNQNKMEYLNNINFMNENNYLRNMNNEFSGYFKDESTKKQFLNLCSTVNYNGNEKPELEVINEFPSILYSNNFGKKLELNILYYDESLKNTEENNLNCSFFKMNIKGTFYGCHNENLFKYICDKIRNSNKEFILISSGSSAEKIYDYWSDICQIKNYYIYCLGTDKYAPLKRSFNKLKGIYNSFDELIQALSLIKPMRNKVIKSSNLIYFNDYCRIYIKLHYEIIRKYSLYKLLKSNNFNETKFIELVKNKRPYYLDLAHQLIYNDEKYMINLFKANTNEKEEYLKKVFDSRRHIIKNYIYSYTSESFYHKYLNKFLREGDFDYFRILSNHISKFIYRLYEYRNDHFPQRNLTLYRNMYLSPEEFNLYKNSIGRVICYPSFTSTSVNQDFEPNYSNNLFIRLIINQNNSKSVVEISEFSRYQHEEEYLFLPFSFFKIPKLFSKKYNS